MEPEEAAPVRRLLIYAENTAGGMMTTEPVMLPPGRHGRRGAGPHPPAGPHARAWPRRSTWPGRPSRRPPAATSAWSHFQRLLREPPSTLLGAIVDTDLDPIRPEFTLNQVAFYLATYNLVAVPVVDEDGRLVGAVTVDDVLDHLLPEDWRDARTARRRSRAWLTGSTSPRQLRRCACVRTTTRRRSAGSRSGSPASSARPVPRLHDRLRRRLGHSGTSSPRRSCSFDPYPFIFLTLMLSLQASYAAPLILLAQNRQDDRDRVQYEHDRGRPSATRPTSSI